MFGILGLICIIAYVLYESESSPLVRVTLQHFYITEISTDFFNHPTNQTLICVFY